MYVVVRRGERGELGRRQLAGSDTILRQVTFSTRSSLACSKKMMSKSSPCSTQNDCKMAATVPVHRCRFVDNTPSAITALAFPPLPLPPAKSRRKSTDATKPLQYGILAIGHANGNIDISEWMGSEHEPPNSQAWVVRQVRDVLFGSNTRD